MAHNEGMTTPPGQSAPAEAGEFAGATVSATTERPDRSDRSGPMMRTYVALDPVWVRRSAIGVLLLLIAWQIGAWILGRLSGFLFLLLIAWLFGIAMDPIVTWLENKGVKRSLATLIVLASTILFSIGFLSAFGGILASQIVMLVQSLPSTVDEAVVWFNNTFDATVDPTKVNEMLSLQPSTIARVASNLAGGIFGILSSVVGVVFQLFTLMLFGYYFAAEGPAIRRLVASWLPQRRQRVFLSVWDIAVAKTGGFVVSRLALAILCAVISAIFLFVIDVPYWLPLAIWIGLVSQFIPTVGTYLGIALPALVAFFNDPLDALLIVIFGTVYQQVENYFFSPRISSATMDIHPAVAFGSVIIGGALAGPMGALIAIPIAAGLIAVLDTYGKRYELVPELAHEELQETVEAESQA